MACMVLLKGTHKHAPPAPRSEKGGFRVVRSRDASRGCREEGWSVEGPGQEQTPGETLDRGGAEISESWALECGASGEGLGRVGVLLPNPVS